MNYLYIQRQEFNQSLTSNQVQILKDIITELSTKTYSSDRVKDTIDYLLNGDGDSISKKLLTRDYRHHIELL